MAAPVGTAPPTAAAGPAQRVREGKERADDACRDHRQRRDLRPALVLEVRLNGDGDRDDERGDEDEHAERARV